MQSIALNPDVWEMIRMRSTDRGVLIGKTGGGKTTLAKYLVEDSRKPYSVTWNPKNSESIESWNQERVTTLQQLYESEAPRIIYTPEPQKARDRRTQEDLFNWIYDRKYTRFYIDEATMLSYLGGMVPDYMTAIFNRGRERAISTLTATQRPAAVPMNILSESEHYYIFRCLLPQDKQRIEAVTGLTSEEQSNLEDYEFYYFNVSKGLLPRKLILKIQGENHGGSTTSAANTGTTSAIAISHGQ